MVGRTRQFPDGCFLCAVSLNLDYLYPPPLRDHLGQIMKSIVIKGAREHNLKNIDVTLPRDRMIVITGVSGSASPHWPSTPYMPRVSGDTWNPSQPMPGSSLS